jgi:hypothetical protein
MQPVCFCDVQVSLDGDDAPGHDVKQLAEEVERDADADPLPEGT